jgi:hypothetical protein
MSTIMTTCAQGKGNGVSTSFLQQCSPLLPQQTDASFHCVHTDEHTIAIASGTDLVKAAMKKADDGEDDEHGHHGLRPRERELRVHQLPAAECWMLLALPEASKIRESKRMVAYE